MFYQPKLSLTVEKIHEDAVIPTYATPGDSGADLYSLEEYVIEPGETVLVRTGLAIDIPIHSYHSSGYRWEMQIRPRSGVSLKTNLRVANSPGTVDNFYREEIKIIVHNVGFQKLGFETDNGGLVIEPKMVPGIFLLDGTGIMTDTLHPFGSYLVRKHDRIAQMVFNEIIRPVEILEGKISSSLSRGSSFGGTGINK